MENIIWKSVVGYEGLYEVSNTGLVKSLNCYKYKKPRLMKLGKRPDGYLCVGLSKNNVTKTKTVHRLVAEAFIPNPDKLEMVNHKDEDKTNNTVGNLEWCSRAYNQLYSLNLHPERKKQFADNFKKPSSFTCKGVPHKYYQKVAILDDSNDIICMYENAATAAKSLGLKTCNITEVCKANENITVGVRQQILKKKRTGGYIFVFLED